MVRKKLGIAGLCLLLLCSCANIRTLVKTSLQGIPLWVTQPDSRTGKEVFVGQGTDENPFNARLEAMNDILSKLSEYLGIMSVIRTIGNSPPRIPSRKSVCPLFVSIVVNVRPI